MANLETLVAYAFAAHGPLHQSMMQNGVLPPHRADQATVAAHLAKHITAGHESSLLEVLICQAGTGVGKTLAIAVVPALYLGQQLLAAPTMRRRALLSTYTTELRAALLREADRVNTVTNQTLLAVCQQALPRPLRFAERRALTGYASPWRTEGLRRQFQQQRINPADRPLVEAYLEWEANSATGEFTEWYQVPDAQGRLPLRHHEMELCLTGRDEPSARYQDVIADRVRADTADIVIVTHAMLMRNVTSGGRLLHTQAPETAKPAEPAEPAETGAPDIGRFDVLIADEADQIPAVAAAIDRVNLSLADLGLLLTQAQTAGATITAARGLLVALRDGWSRLVGKGRHRAILPDDQIAAAFAADLAQLETACDAVRRQINRVSDPLTSELLTMTIAGLRRLRDFTRQPPPRDADVARQPNPAVIELVWQNDDFSVTLTSQTAQYHSWSLWRSAVHDFDSVALLSATLQDTKRSFNRFRGAIGLLQPPNRVRVAETEVPTPHFGKIGRIELPWPREVYRPTDINAQDMMNPQHLTMTAQYIALTLSAAIARGDRHYRQYVICHRLSMRDALATLLRGMGFGAYVVVPGYRQKAQALVHDLAAIDYGVFLGSNWEGINLVDDRTGVNLIKHVTLARLPMPPLNPTIAAHASGSGAVYARIAAIEECFRKTINGIGRGLRSALDEITLGIMDIRFPMPLKLAQAIGVNHISMCDPTSMFMGFDAVIRPQKPLAGRHYVLYDPLAALPYGALVHPGRY